ncbi:MAG: cyclic nucleotide-binding domain-containing protein [Syntrophobacteraceae bacterium]
MDNMTTRHERVQEYLAGNNKAAAVGLLFEMIVDCAKGKDFTLAESLRNRILEIDSFALSEIINSGEIIEKEKKAGIDKNHYNTWRKLYNILTMEEGNAFYYSLKSTVYSPDETVCKQGQFDSRFFLIDSGNVTVTCWYNGMEKLIRVIGPGQMIGEDTFFTNSILTTSLTAASGVEIRWVRLEALRSLKTNFPELEAKLQNFVSQFPQVKDLLQSMGVERRKHKRIRIDIRGSVQLMGGNGNPVGAPFRVGIQDISQGGTCFIIRIANKERAGSLLGKKLRIRLLHSIAQVAGVKDLDGTILAVKLHPFEDCSVHIKFDTMIPEGLIQELLNLPRMSVR